MRVAGDKRGDGVPRTGGVTGWPLSRRKALGTGAAISPVPVLIP